MADASYPEDLRYHASHVWVRTQDELVAVGLTWHAQQAIGDIVDFAPPEPGLVVSAGTSFADLESVKAVTDVLAPVSGEITEVNTAVVGSPEQVNEDPYGAWLVRIRPSDPTQLDALLDAAGYEASLA